MKNSSINQKKINEIVDDEVIIKQFFERDERAIVNIEQNYGKYCYSIAFRILLNEKDTEECINDTWLKVWDSIPPIIPEILSAFIGKITRNQAINKYKYENASKRVNSRIEKTLDELNECEILLNNNVSEEMDRKELENSINKYLEKLPKQKRQIFVRRYFYLDEIKEIADRFNLKESAVKVLLHRMRRKLKSYLENEGYEIY